MVARELPKIVIRRPRAGSREYSSLGRVQVARVPQAKNIFDATRNPVRLDMVVLMEILEPARVEERPALPYVGIRVITPFRGMLAVRDRLLAEARTEIKQAGIETVGYGFLRLYVIDMRGLMDLEAGYFTVGPTHHFEDQQLRPGSMPAGSFATMTYRDHALRANKSLQDWARDNTLELSRRTVLEGDKFACRYEAFWTDPAVEPRKTKWRVELAILLAQ